MNPRAHSKLVCDGFGFYLVLCLVLTLSNVAPANESKPFNVSNLSQVFIDKALVGAESNVTFTLHPAETRKHPAGYSGPWFYNANTKGPPTTQIFKDEDDGLFKSWSPDGSHKTSTNGLDWGGATEPGHDSWTRNQVTWYSIFKDERDQPSRRFKVVAYCAGREVPPKMKDTDFVIHADGTSNLLWHVKGYYQYVSPDGKALTLLGDKALVYQKNGRPETDIVRAYYDRRLKCYVAFPKIRNVAGRQFGIMTSPDFITWSECRTVFAGDQRDKGLLPDKHRILDALLAQPIQKDKALTQFYHVGGPIQLESCTLALPLAYLGVGLTSGKPDDGASEFQLAISRDLVHWERPFREPAIPRGKVDSSSPKGSADAYKNSDWDSCFFLDASEAIAVGDEYWIYYRAYNASHGLAPWAFNSGTDDKFKGGIGLARWKRDRFVSVDTSSTGGTLTTVPVIFDGNRLELNAATQEGGEVVVKLMDQDGGILGKSKPFSGDDFRHKVQWESPLDLAGLAGKPVTLQFKMKSAELFAFAFRK